MMNEERMKILEMLKDGIIDVSEASELLKTLDSDKKEVKALKGSTKMLRIKVLSGDGDKVNVQVPVSLLNALNGSGSLKGFINKSVNKKDGEDFIGQSIDVDALMQMIESGVVGKLVDVESADGDIVEIYID